MNSINVIFEFCHDALEKQQVILFEFLMMHEEKLEIIQLPNTPHRWNVFEIRDRTEEQNTLALSWVENDPVERCIDVYFEEYEND